MIATLIVAMIRSTRVPVDEVSLQFILNNSIGRNSTWSQHTQRCLPLRLTLPELTHAIVKADSLRGSGNFWQHLSTFLELAHVIDCQGDLGLRGRVLEDRTDFVRTSLTGRVGQGLALLFAQQRGYAFAGHLKKILISQGRCVQGNNPMADFVVKGENITCILEAKGSNSEKNSLNKTRRLMRDALVNQVRPWMTSISPPASKALVVASYIRDQRSSQRDPSVLAFVEADQRQINNLYPGGNPPIALIDNLPPMDIKRFNYSGWLRAIGLTGAAHRLQNQISEGVSKTAFWAVGVGNEVIMVPETPFNFQLVPAFFRRRAGTLYEPPHTFTIGFPILGIERNTLRQISRTITGEQNALDEISPRDSELESNQSAEAASYSFFPDHTFFGVSDRLDFGQFWLEREIFEL